MSIGFGGLLFIAFLVLKLTGVIDWSWLWVTSPLWIGFLLSLFWFAVFLAIGERRQRSWQRRRYR